MWPGKLYKDFHWTWVWKVWAALGEAKITLGKLSRKLVNSAPKVRDRKASGLLQGHKQRDLRLGASENNGKLEVIWRLRLGWEDLECQFFYSADTVYSSQPGLC